jgi:16S rRNA (adenine1518-N6/adenine1519-N6)-dimethyltransferase
LSSSTRDILLKKASKVRAKKRLGQNFLIEPSVLTKIVESLNLKSDDLVVEIGPGLGFLTQELLKTGARVFAIELDREMV